MEKKKPTNAQLQRRIDNALIHVDRTKDTEEMYFSDKGVRLVANTDFAMVETNYHTHVFRSFTSNGVSRPWLYVKRFIEIANTNDCLTEDGYSYAKLFSTLKEDKTKETEYNIATYVDWWLLNIFTPLYTIGENDIEAFLVYEEYVHNISKNSIMLSEKTQDMTNKDFLNGVIATMKEIADDLNESVLFHKQTDEELMQENIEAISEMENEKVLNQQNENNESKD